MNFSSAAPRLEAKVTTFSAGCDQMGCSARAASRHLGTQVASHVENSVLIRLAVLLVAGQEPEQVSGVGEVAVVVVLTGAHDRRE